MSPARKDSPEGKCRLDALLVERGLAESRTLAQRLIMAGEVRVDGQVSLKAGREVDRAAAVEVTASPRFVSRGGEKLEAALSAFGLEPREAVCADVGASTGGFTHCLLQHGARRVYALDVGRGILHWKLRQDPRVVVMEGVNARYVEALPEPVDWATIDTSFISLLVVLPAVVRWLKPEAEVVALVKPQFEAGRKAVGRGGVVRDPLVHQRVLEGVLAGLAPLGLHAWGLVRSPLLGPKGNVEFLLWARPGSPAPGGPPSLPLAPPG